MENLLINKIDQQISLYPYNYTQIISPLKQFFFLDEQLQKILEKAMMIENRKDRINLSLNMSPKKIITDHTISVKIQETADISNNSALNVNISLNDDSSLKFFIEEGVSI
ncbi:MAG: hypothetical protein PHF25_06920 [Candidatus Margulisbacteria bacterium]|nr:hypothetical protein [Candidatus Margulisiibacteriota bacterium]